MVRKQTFALTGCSDAGAAIETTARHTVARGQEHQWGIPGMSGAGEGIHSSTSVMLERLENGDGAIDIVGRARADSAVLPWRL